MRVIPIVLLLFGLSSTLAQNTISPNTTTQTTTQPTSQGPTTTPHPSCETKSGTTCEECLAYVDVSLD
ncbi:hypothetical protein cypCar_00014283 [Cyprinus carpio]|nr:hypothetical protein cypCar_00014283 [Cyprinus carpio]